LGGLKGLSSQEVHMKIAYLDCFSGASGDMLLGALIDAGLDVDVIRGVLAGLGIEGYQLKANKVLKKQISATKIWLEGSEKDQAPRTLSIIRALIQGSSLSDTVKRRSTQVFEHLAKAEAKIHGCPPEEIHFHEIGAVDSIVDIVGVLTGLEAMGIAKVFASALPLGSGFTHCDHGKIPLPAPATVELLKGIPVYDSGLGQELVTPTGAALLREIVEKFGTFPPMQILETGYGAGTRDLTDRPNVLRMIIGEVSEEAPKATEIVSLLETTIDDSTPELLGYLMEQLFEAGALDVAFFPVHMKKNRPGVHIQVMAQPNDHERLTDIIFRETTTLGVRLQHVQRTTLARSEEKVDSPWGPMRVKRIREAVGADRIVPEYEVCRQIAKRHQIPLKEVYAWIEALNRS